MSTPRAALKQIARQAMRERGFEPDFSAAALTQASQLSESSAQPANRQDLRDRLWCSIDNEDSRDLDQLSVAEARPRGIGILVAIADVDALVRRHSPIDQHASANTTSVYTAAEIFAMLPEQLSTDLSSLVENADRAAIVVDMTVADDGTMTSATLFPAIVRNHARLAYPSVGAWLEGRGPEPPPLATVPGLAQNLRMQSDAAAALKRSRHRRGALTLDTAEGKPVFAGDELRDIAAIDRSRASELIEDFMIAANTATAQFLESRGFSSMRRIVRMPDRWPRIVTLAAGTGTTLPTTPDVQALEHWLLAQRERDPEHFPDLSLSVVKLLGRGTYVVEPPNEPTPDHFGLAVDDYAHTTAPNRRFADLVTQRLVKAALAGAVSPYEDDELAAIAARCSEREDAANRVERQVRKAAAAMLLERRRGEVFDGIVTGASPKGTWVKLRHPLTEGRIERGQEGLEVGDRVRVRLVAVDPWKGFIDFERLKQ
ncbi:MAG TPA: RNB domain-containing ribonuclease [Vicinamibacterales bacterium]|nr:RNB domain-containing ribonuclease [Vicinamibacterales bacterium]